MTTLREAAQMALEALDRSETTVPYEGFGMAHREAERKHTEAITALRAALATGKDCLQVEPVAVALHTGTKQGIKWIREVEHGTNLFTAPPQRKPLTDEEIWNNDKIMAANSGYGATFETLSDALRFTRAVERAHGIGGEE